MFSLRLGVFIFDFEYFISEQIENGYNKTVLSPHIYICSAHSLTYMARLMHANSFNKWDDYSNHSVSKINIVLQLGILFWFGNVLDLSYLVIKGSTLYHTLMNFEYVIATCIIHIYSGITHGRVLNGELLYT